MVISLSGFLSHRRVVIVHLFSRALLSRRVFVPSADSLLFFRHWYREEKVACSNVRWFVFCFRSGSDILVHIIS